MGAIYLVYKEWKVFFMSRYSYFSHLQCPQCGLIFSGSEVRQLCGCGSPLLARYDLEALRQVLPRPELEGRETSLWRYHELLPVERPENVVTLGEGMTPLLPLPRLGAAYDLPHLYMKDEGIIPTGSFKARGAAVGLSKAKELGVRQFAMPTNGNAGAAWSLYAARAGIRASVVMPVDAPLITRGECAVSGADLYLVNGLISDAGRLVAGKIASGGIYDASTLKEPYRIEGKKTMGIEIAEQFGWTLPDVILYPTGGGVGLIGIYKALSELLELGWIEGPLPRLVAVQAAGCAPIVKAWQEGASRSEFWPNSGTAAFGINVPKALGDFLVLEAVYATGGCAVAVEDEALLSEQRLAASLEGAFVCPEGAAAFAAARKLRESGWIRDGERVVVLNTGMGIKYPETIPVNAPVLQPEDALPS
ncbi:threonine synthase [Paenibacillus mucilaginosus]|uniref:threonine synthase n=1 Tax=Paenibacillus mucilaginosus TaxID=61624 RepID=UPI003D1A72B0